jgi:hypothetical protein
MIGLPMRRPSIVLLAAIALLLIGAGRSEWPPIGSTGLAANAVRPIRVSIAIKSRKLANEIQKSIRITQGDVLELVFTTDESAELHLHGYDIYLNVEPGTPSVLRVDAKIAGRFPLESHRFGGATGEQSAGARSHAVLLYVEVYPR